MNLYRPMELPYPFTALRERLRSFDAALWLLFVFFAMIVAASGIFILEKFNNALLVEVPTQGGAIREGIVGSPRFANPLLALSDADRDLATLVYAGLMKATPEGEFVPELAASYEISDDGLRYTFIIREDAVFHDGEPVTADDIVFTVQTAQDGRIKSPKRANWEGVVAEKVGEREIRFSLTRPYAPFLENTAVGILPKHIWKNADPEQFSFSQFNIDPVGAGPYKVAKIKRNSSGVPLSYTLVPFRKYVLGEPYVAEIVLKFYANESALVDALKQGLVDSVNSLSPNRMSELSTLRAHVHQTPLPRIFAVFFNQNQAEIFADKTVRKALDAAVDKQAVIDHVLGGFGVPIESPLPPRRDEASAADAHEHPEDSETSDIAAKESERNRLERAAEMLEKAGWKKNDSGIFERTVKKETQTLAFTLATSDTPELAAVADILKQTWERLGARVTLEIFETGDLNHTVIRPRKYDALLFGEVIGRDLDLFAFWHSSQRADPGLNIALYANIAADKLLETARSMSDSRTREEVYAQFEKVVVDDTPAVFLYAPDFIYLTQEKLRAPAFDNIATPADRFLGVERWFVETEKVWSVFVSDQE